MITAYKCENGLYKVDFSIGYQTNIHGHFTAEQDAKFKFRHLVDLTEIQAKSVAGLAEACYGMGYNTAKREVANKLGLLRML